MTEQQQYPTPPDTPEANARARAEGQTITFEQAGQQYPTREQIFDALNGNWFDDDWDSQINLDVTTAGQIADAVLALFQNGADRG